MEDVDVQIRILGPLVVHTAGVVLPLGSRKQRQVLSLLAVHANRVVGVEEIVDELWPQAPPTSAAPNARSYVGQLRRALESAEPGADRLIRDGAGYLLRAGPDELDLLAYSAQVTAGRDELRRGNAAAAAAAFRDALANWRGPMLAGLPRLPVVAARCAVVEDERLEIVEELAALDLALDRPQEAADALRNHVHSHPLRERGRVLLMRALYRGGDTPAALTAYADGVAALAEQLGIEPGPDLRQLHQAILTGRPDAEPGRPSGDAAPARPGGDPRPVPAQLPLDVYGFTGRLRELALLDAVLATVGDEPTAVVISAIAGTAGVGKTALALHWAHRVRERFPDGQLYVNLRGFDLSGAVMDPAEAIHRFLEALQVPSHRIPDDVDAQAALYRTLLAGRRMLIVLDNARDADQIRPLLPGSAGCLVLVTSRNRLTSLVAAEGAHPLPLDLLTRDEARALLTRRLGPARAGAEPDAVDELVTLCAGLPLALAIVAANAAGHPRLPLAELTAQLRDTQARLDALSTGDTPATDVRAVFSWSYHALTPAAARLFRLLGLHPGPDISAPAAASLAGVPPSHADPLLAELIRAHLLAEPIPGRYACHDLLRAYARELAHAHDPEPDRRAAVHRLLDHYLHTAHTAAELLYPGRHPIALAPPAAAVTPEELADRDQALAWFIGEHLVLLAALGQATEAGFDSHAWQLAWTFWDYFERRGHLHDWVECQRAAIAAAGRLADPAALARSHNGLAIALAVRRDYEQAAGHYQRALELFEAVGDRLGQANLQLSLVELSHAIGQPRKALRHARLALDLFAAAGDPTGQGNALNSIGWLHVGLGDHEQALLHSRQALAMHSQVHDDGEEVADAWDSLGYVHHHRGEYAEAVTCYERALRMFRDLGDRHDEAITLVNLGDTHAAAGSPDEARAVWQRALTILEELDHPDADGARARLGTGALATRG